MSDDPSDAVAEAIALNKRLAATKLVRKEEVTSELADLRKLRAQSDAEEPELDGRIAERESELAALDYDIKTVMREVEELRKLGRGLPAAVARAQVNAILNPDPLMQSPEQAALERMREHIGNVDAQARLGDELGALKDPAAAPRPVSRATAEADARAKFEALRGQRGGAASSPASAAQDDSLDGLTDPPPRPPSKKTL